MLPNLRLMAAASFASVAVLIFGFGVFAAFSVSHAPLERPPHVAPLRLVTSTVAAQSLTAAAAEPFDNRFQIDEGGSMAGVSALAYAAPQATEPSAMKFFVAVAGDHEQDATSEPLATESADTPKSSQQAANLAVAPETKPDDVTGITSEQAAPAPPRLAAAETPGATAAEVATANVTPGNVGPTNRESAPAETHEATLTTELDSAPAGLAAGPAQTVPDAAAKRADKESEQLHVTSKPHRGRKGRAAPIDAAFAVGKTQSADAWQPETEKAPAKSRRTRSAVNTRAPSAAAIGGPFVSVPAR